MVGTNWMRVLAAMAFVGAANTAYADILFIDTNDQAVERRTIDELGRRYGERVHIVKGDGPELDELFSRAERGEIKLTSIVASGHSSGTGFGGQAGSFHKVEELVNKYPNARNQVRHFIGLGCYTGTKYASLEWASRFPNATVLAGFNGIAPSGVWSARFLDQVFTSLMDAKRRAGNTEDAFARRLGSDRATVEQLKQALVALSSVRITVASFQFCDQFYDPKGGTVRERLKHDVESGMRVFRDYLNAWSREDVPADPHAPSLLRSFYNDVQAYLGEAPVEERPELVKTKEQTIRLIYFGHVKKNVARTVTPSDVDKANAVFGPLPATRVPGEPAPVRFPTAEQISTMNRKQINELVRNLGYELNSLPGQPGANTGSYDEDGGSSSTPRPAGPPPSPESLAAARALHEKLQKQLVDLDVPFSYIDAPPAG